MSGIFCIGLLALLNLALAETSNIFTFTETVQCYKLMICNMAAKTENDCKIHFSCPESKIDVQSLIRRKRRNRRSRILKALATFHWNKSWLLSQQKLYFDFLSVQYHFWPVSSGGNFWLAPLETESKWKQKSKTEPSGWKCSRMGKKLDFEFCHFPIELVRLWPI